MPLFPPLNARKTGMLPVSPLHTVYWEESGNPDGIPVVFVHGGPGAGTEPTHRRFFDPARYRIVLFDQRGSGLSTPHAELRENTTWDLVADMEKLRDLLGIDRWVVFGGSWGSTLALAYAVTWPERVAGLVLRGIFLLRDKEIRWFYQGGAHFLFPDAWEDYLAPIPGEEREDLVGAYYKRLTSEDAEVRLAAARAWSIWEARTSKLLVSEDLVARYEDATFALAFARIECHYFVHRGFFQRDDFLLHQASRLQGIPGVIVQGRYDVVCPMTSAWELHAAWPDSRLVMVPDAGHSAFEPGIEAELVTATEEMADRLAR
ncbi:MAG: prolyl aminopeptidase [Pseudomonadota bacterium]|nr:prolyl aminopeptidase [Pseudomonadota bacterium]